MNDHPSAPGIVQCLSMLAEEAAALRLDRTLAALRTAMEVCIAESSRAEVAMCLPQGAMLH